MHTGQYMKYLRLEGELQSLQVEVSSDSTNPSTMEWAYAVQGPWAQMGGAGNASMGRVSPGKPHFLGAPLVTYLL